MGGEWGGGWERGIWVDLWQCQADCSARMLEVVPRNGVSLASRVLQRTGAEAWARGSRPLIRYAEREL